MTRTILALAVTCNPADGVSYTSGWSVFQGIAWCMVVRIPQGPKRLGKKACVQTKYPKRIPQGLKPSFIFG
jgi:hypothetical protein